MPRPRHSEAHAKRRTGAARVARRLGMERARDAMRFTLDPLPTSIIFDYSDNI